MKQLRTIKKKASSLIHTGADVETETKGNEELAKDVLLELSDALQEGPEVDPYMVRPASDNEEASPIFKRTLAHANTFTESHSMSLRRDIERTEEGPKHKFLLRKRQSQGSPTRQRLERKINYIEYSCSPKRSLRAPYESEQSRYEELRGSTVYVAKVKPQPAPQAKYSNCILDAGKFIMCQELPTDLINPKIWNDLKRVTKQSGKNVLWTSMKRPARNIFQLDTGDDRDTLNNSTHCRFKNQFIDRKLNGVSVKFTRTSRSKTGGFGVSYRS